MAYGEGPTEENGKQERRYPHWAFCWRQCFSSDITECTVQHERHMTTVGRGILWEQEYTLRDKR
jgi:hypothetical protein